MPEEKHPALLAGLNPEQTAAVSHGEGPVLVLAGAGSGKTRVLTRRLAYLVGGGVADWQIVALTFTNKAAGEMKERVNTLLGGRARSFVGTFHSYCVRLLRRFHKEAGLPSSFVVMDAADQLAIVKRAMAEKAVPEKAFTPRSLQARISQAKNADLSFDEYTQRFGDYLGTVVVGVHRVYERMLSQSGGVDFDDLLVKSLRLLRDQPQVLEVMRRSVAHLLVDEFQDTNRIQAALVKTLAGEKRNVFAVGDEDQSIYRWRGADVGNVLDFNREFPDARVVRLERNYRSTAPILAAAGAVVAENQRRLGKTLRAQRSGGDKVRLLSFDEERDEAREVVARIAAFRRGQEKGEVAVLFRTNAQSRPFEEELNRLRLPYQLVGGTRFYERAEVKDALAYLRLIRNQGDDLSFRRVVNVPARGIGTVTVEAIEAAAGGRSTSLFGALEVLPAGITERARKALTEFRALVTRLGEIVSKPDLGAEDAVAAVLGETGLLALYAESNDVEDESRRDNLEELRSAAREHDRAVRSGEEGTEEGLAGFLDAVTLRADADEVDERRGIVLLTMHAAKGLEFDEVFLVGAEDGSLPHVSSSEDPEELEEERRLAYVGMTRAKDRLTISHVRRRMVRGEWKDREPSPFLAAIPQSVLAREDFSGRRFGGSAGGSLFGGGGAGGHALFPDYEGESQEPSFRRVQPPPMARRAAAPARPSVPPMKRTPPPPSASGFRRGSKVRHPEYGTGVVLTIEGSGDSEKLTVYFERAGPKKFIARFANLSPA